MRLLKHYDIEISGKHAVIVGRSPILGKPMAMMLLNENATVTICHSKTQGLDKHIQKADILVHNTENIDTSFPNFVGTMNQLGMDIIDPEC